MVDYVSKERFKRIKKLNHQKYRDYTNDCFDVLIEGEKLIHQVVLFGISLQAIYTIEDRYKVVEKIVQNQPCPIYFLSESQSQSLTETQTGQGIFAQVGFVTKPILHYNKLLYLNDISDPGNLGTIIRTASSFSIDGIIIDEQCCDIANSKVIRSSMGSVFAIPIMKSNKEWLEKQKCRIVVSDVHMGVSLDKYQFPKIPFILVLGSEAKGVSESIIEIANDRVFIPLSGKMESLNVAVATGIFLFKTCSEK